MNTEKYDVTVVKLCLKTNFSQTQKYWQRCISIYAKEKR